MKMVIIGLLIPIAFSMAQVPLKDKIQEAQRKARKPIRKLDKRNQWMKTNNHLNGKFLDHLANNKELTMEQMRQEAKNEHDYIESCLNSESLGVTDKHWLKDYEKIIDKLWDKDSYIGLQEKYSATETCITVKETIDEKGKTIFITQPEEQYNYGVTIIRDHTDPAKFWINNFYNIGFDPKFRVSVIQDGTNLKIPPTTVNASLIQSTSGETYKNGNFTLTYSVDDGGSVDTCKIFFSPERLK